MTRWLLALALLVPAALAQRAPSGTSDPAARYHEGAQAFVNGDIGEARAAVQAGLEADPDNARLQALRDLIEQEQEEQDQRQGGQQDNDAQNSQEGQDQPEGDSGESDPPPPDNSEAEQDQTRTDPQEPGDQQGGEGQRPGEGEATPEGTQPVPEGQMSRAQAERILEAVGGDEKLLLREMRRAPTRARRSEKDW